jgi:hypothetical protein
MQTEGRTGDAPQVLAEAVGRQDRKRCAAGGPGEHPGRAVADAFPARSRPATDHRQGDAGVARDDAALARRARPDHRFRQGAGRKREKPRRRRSKRSTRRCRGLRSACGGGRAEPARAAADPGCGFGGAEARRAAQRSKNPVVGASLPAPALAQAQPADPVPQAAARTDDSLLAKTIGIKDQVVSVTQRAVSATIGVIPSWFGSLGDRIGGEGQSPRPPANLVSASWIVPSAADR